MTSTRIPNPRGVALYKRGYHSRMRTGNRGRFPKRRDPCRSFRARWFFFFFFFFFRGGGGGGGENPSGFDGVRTVVLTPGYEVIPLKTPPSAPRWPGTREPVPFEILPDHQGPILLLFFSSSSHLCTCLLFASRGLLEGELVLLYAPVCWRDPWSCSFFSSMQPTFRLIRSHSWSEDIIRSSTVGMLVAPRFPRGCTSRDRGTPSHLSLRSSEAPKKFG